MKRVALKVVISYEQIESVKEKKSGEGEVTLKNGELIEVSKSVMEKKKPTRGDYYTLTDDGRSTIRKEVDFQKSLVSGNL